MPDLVVVTGGARSGKSAVAEQLLARSTDVTYIATARPRDDELRERIRRHRARRPAGWRTVEADDLLAALREAPAAVLLDGLGLWIAARLDQPDAAVLDEIAAFAEAAAGHHAAVVVVVEQAGSGLVPLDRDSRRWVDLVGEATQILGRRATRVLLAVGGRVTPLSAPSPMPLVEDALRQHGDTMVPTGALDLAVNVHGDQPPPHIAAAIAAADLSRYPDEAQATSAIAQRHDRAAEEVVLTAGAADAFWLLASAVAARKAAVVHPQFTEPDAALRAAGVAVTEVYRRAEDDWALDPAAVPDDADLVVVGRPNNPTGTLDPLDSVLALCRRGRKVVVDEAFIDFVEDEPVHTLAGRRSVPGLIVVRSITKLWALAGLRAGYLVAEPAVASACRRMRRPWAVSSPAINALQACAVDEAHRVQVARAVAAQRQELVRALRDVPKVEVWESCANFVLLRVPDGPAVHAALLARGIAVRPSTFPGLSADHLRVAVRDAGATHRLRDALTELLT